jgi:hypothetical protein
MVHLFAVLLGALVIAVLFGVFYVIHSVFKHFGLDTEEIVLTVILLALLSLIAWMFGSIALGLLGLL